MELNPRIDHGLYRPMDPRLYGGGLLSIGATKLSGSEECCIVGSVAAIPMRARASETSAKGAG